METTQRVLEDAAGKVAHSTKNERETMVKRTPETVRIREEAAARCAKVV